MPYSDIPFSRISNPVKQDVFRRANMYLADAYSMLGLRPRASSNAGKCNFSIALVLASVIDGIARDIYPTIAVASNQETRFKKLIRDKLPWEHSRRDWVEIGIAAKYLYVEFRNPLTHELGKGVGKSKRKPKDYEPVVYRWRTNIQGRVDRLDARKIWDPDWPILVREVYKDGTRLALSGAALYWAVKRMVANLARAES